MGRACNRICRPPSMCSPLATTETATMRRVFVGLARCSWASRRNYEITASSSNYRLKAVDLVERLMEIRTRK